MRICDCDSSILFMERTQTDNITNSIENALGFWSVCTYLYIYINLFSIEWKTSSVQIEYSDNVTHRWKHRFTKRIKRIFMQKKLLHLRLLCIQRQTASARANERCEKLSWMLKQWEAHTYMYINTRPPCSERSHTFRCSYDITSQFGIRHI